MGIFSVIYTIQDEKGATSTTELNIPDVTSFANAVVFAGEMAKLINPLIKGAITRIGIVASIALPVSIRVSPLTGSDVEEGGRWQFRTENNFYSGLRLPTLDEAFVLPSTRTIDGDDTDVLAFNVAMVAGVDLSGAGGTGTVSPVDKRGEDLIALEFAREQFLSSRRS